jgi:molybdopterin-guanine dinucleotide biosynthesis protein A
MTIQTNLSCAGFVLAGGQSSRMGVDKALLELHGRTLLERALETMRGVCDAVSIVGDTAKFATYGTVVEDVYAGCGPLAGIHAALLNSSAELNLVMAVDMPFVSRELLAFLLATAAETDAIAAVPRSGQGYQPLSAVYRHAFAPAAEAALRAGTYKIDALFSTVVVREIGEEELRRAGFSEKMFLNVNTPEDLRSAQNDG